MTYPVQVGRYIVYAPIAAGGMATVHLGRLVGPVGFSRTVAIKRMHPQFASDPEFVAMFLDEARLAARIRHPNVISTVDVVAEGGEILLVMDYVPGESLSKLAGAARRAATPLPGPVTVGLMLGILHGLQAAHDARDERGEPLGIVHRDLSPQNVLVGSDGAPRVLDFGIAKAAGRIHQTKEHTLKGKLAYMAPEQLSNEKVDRRADIYAAGVMLWELVVGKRLYGDAHEAQIVTALLMSSPPAPTRALLEQAKSTGANVSSEQLRIAEQLEPVILRAMSRAPRERHGTAIELAEDIARFPAASAVHIARCLDGWLGASLRARDKLVTEVERGAEPADLEALIAAIASTPSLADSGSSPHVAAARATHTILAATTVNDPAASSGGASHTVPGAVVPPGSRDASARRMRRLLFALLLAVLGVGGLQIFIALRPQGGSPPAASALPGSLAAPPALPGASAPSASVVPEPPASVATAAPTAAPSMVTDPPPIIPPPHRGSATPPRGVGAGARKPEGAPAASNKPIDACDPPYFVDSAGIRRLKKGCI